MSLQIIRNINVDFYDNQYIMINAKQYDDASRFIAITCYVQDNIFNLNAGEHVAYVRFRKSDGHTVFNTCIINQKGQALVELTEQMLIVNGVCYVDLVVVNKGKAIINIDTGEVTTIDNSTIMSTMAFCVYVYESAVDNSLIESLSDFSGLNEVLKEAQASYEEVVMLARSYAIGDAGGIRENEDIDNAKYYANNALNSAADAANSASESYSDKLDAERYADDAALSEANALTYANNAQRSANNASNSEASAANSAIEAHSDKLVAERYANNAQSSADYASSSAASAEVNKNETYNYYVQVESMMNGLNGAFIPMGSISFLELELLNTDDVGVGYLYNITEDFTTTSSFKNPDGNFPAGTSVYRTGDGYWDILVGTTVTGVKGESESTYRKGNVNITADNVGAVSINDIVTIDEVKNYLGI